MRRRVFIGLLSAAAASWPVALYAQQTKIVRIGALYLGHADAESFKANLREGLRELGYVEGQNIAFEFRSAEGKADQLPLLAGELVRLKVDVIAWPSTFHVRWLQNRQQRISRSSPSQPTQ